MACSSAYTARCARWIRRSRGRSDRADPRHRRAKVPIAATLDPHGQLSAKRVKQQRHSRRLQGISAHRFRRARGGMRRPAAPHHPTARSSRHVGVRLPHDRCTAHLVAADARLRRSPVRTGEERSQGSQRVARPRLHGRRHAGERREDAGHHRRRQSRMATRSPSGSGARCSRSAARRCRTFLDVDDALDKALAGSGSAASPPSSPSSGTIPAAGRRAMRPSFLQRLLDRKIPNVAVGTIWDPIAVKHAFVAGEGARHSAAVRRKIGALLRRPDRCHGHGEADSSATPRRISAPVSWTGRFRAARRRGRRGDPQHLSAPRPSSGRCFPTWELIPRRRTFWSSSRRTISMRTSRKLGREVIYARAGHPYPDDPKTNATGRCPRTCGRASTIRLQGKPA